MLPAGREECHVITLHGLPCAPAGANEGRITVIASVPGHCGERDTPVTFICEFSGKCRYVWASQPWITGRRRESGHLQTAAVAGAVAACGLLVVGSAYAAIALVLLQFDLLGALVTNSLLRYAVLFVALAISSVLGIAWAILTFFIVPVILLPRYDGD